MSDDPGASEGRIDALEIRIAYQDETIEALNQTIAGQWAAIDMLKRDLARLAERLENAADEAVQRPPPHY